MTGARRSGQGREPEHLEQARGLGLGSLQLQPAGLARRIERHLAAEQAGEHVGVGLDAARKTGELHMKGARAEGGADARDVRFPT